jgi:hypothetical protein
MKLDWPSGLFDVGKRGFLRLEEIGPGSALESLYVVPGTFYRSGLRALDNNPQRPSAANVLMLVVVVLWSDRGNDEREYA